MIIFPAIDIKDNKCVRLLQGDFDKVNVYGDDPSLIAKKWQNSGAEFIHMVSLNGARGEGNVNDESIKTILDTIHIPIQIGGGIRNKERVKELLDLGVNRVILGSVAIKNKELLKDLVKEYKEKIVVSIDAKDGKVAIEGWEEVSDVNSITFCRELEKIGVYKIDGVLADLGVSSHQLDEADRGFSYMHDAPLDMRMDIRKPFSAYDVVNTYSEEQLAKIIKDYGEDNWAKRIAKFIVEARDEKPIEKTGELVDVIKKAIPKKARIDGPHPAKRTFQAIRIEVNNELGVINKMIEDAVSIMNKKGRICIITFHSLEDRIVKNEFKDLALNCVCPPELPICQCNKKSEVKVITRKPILPSDEEVERNPRARSAKLRVAEKK